MYFFKKYFLKTRGRMTKSLFNSNGMSTTEVLVAAGLMAVVSLGVVTMMQNSAIEQKRQTLMATLKDLQMKIQNVVRDQTSWEVTIKNNASTACLKNITSCSVTADNAPLKISLYDAAGNQVYNLLDWSETGSGKKGFTETGASCDTFVTPPADGNDNCPISYRLVVGFQCNSGSSCGNPQLKVTARLLYNPAKSGTYLNRYRSMISTGSMTSTNELANPNVDGKFDVAIRRTGAMINRFFTIKMVKTSPSGSGCANAGVGTCDTASMTLHPLTWDNSSVDDLFGLLTAPSTSGAAVQYFQFKESGYYSCTASVTAYGTRGFRADIYNQTTGVVVASAATVAAPGSQANAVIENKFIVNSVSDHFIIREKCDSSAENQCSLGMSLMPYANPTTIVSMTCYKFDKNF